MTATTLFVNGLKFKAIVKESTRNSVLLFGDSLVKELDMQEMDKVCLSGGRCADLRTIIQSSNFSRYRVVILMFGGNDLQGRYKGNVFRKSLSPQEIAQNLLEISFYLSNRNVDVYVMGIPYRGNQTFLKIKELNSLLFASTGICYEFVGLGGQLSKASVISGDKVHLSDEGISRLKTIFKNKILKYL